MNDEKLGQIVAEEPHPIFSAIVDMYLVEMFVGVVSSLTMYFIKVNYIKAIFLFFGSVLLITTIIYHAKFAKTILWLSPGEIIGGKSITNTKKVWQNPYGINRIGLFFICILTLLIFRKTDAVTENLTSILEILGLLIKAIVVTYSLILIGKGKLRGIIIINIFLLLSFGLSMFINITLIRYSGYFSLGIFSIFTLIGSIYHKNRSTKTTDVNKNN